MNSLREIKDTVLSGTSVFYLNVRNRVKFIDGQWYVVHYFTDGTIHNKGLLSDYKDELFNFFTLTNTFR